MWRGANEGAHSQFWPGALRRDPGKPPGAPRFCPPPPLGAGGALLGLPSRCRHRPPLAPSPGSPAFAEQPRIGKRALERVILKRERCGEAVERPSDDFKASGIERA